MFKKAVGSAPTEPSGSFTIQGLFLLLWFSASSALVSRVLILACRVFGVSSESPTRHSASVSLDRKQSMSRLIRLISSWTVSILPIRVVWHMLITCIRVSKLDRSPIASSGSFVLGRHVRGGGTRGSRADFFCVDGGVVLVGVRSAPFCHSVPDSVFYLRGRLQVADCRETAEIREMGPELAQCASAQVAILDTSQEIIFFYLESFICG